MLLNKVLSIVMIVVSLLTTGINRYTQLSEKANSSPISSEEMISLLQNYSDYLSSGTKTLIDPTVTNLLDERVSFYNELFNVGLNSTLTSIKSAYSFGTMKLSDEDGTYTVNVDETVTLAGKYNLDKPEDYPVIKAGQWASVHAVDQNVKSAIDEYVSRQLAQAKESFGETGEFETSLELRHKFTILKTGDGLEIKGDAFDDKSNDNPEGVDVAVWNGTSIERSKPDLTKMPDYQINHTSIEELGKEILASYSSQNVTTSQASISGARVNDKASMRPMFSFYRVNAINYINQYTSNTTSNCTNYPTIYQNTSYYNTQSYQTQDCNDCVNYVSQALVAGSVPTDGTWSPYSYAWINVTGFINYFTSTGKGTTGVSCSTSSAGDIAYLTDMSHVVMISALLPMRYSGHTNDRLKYTWNSNFACMRING